MLDFGKINAYLGSRERQIVAICMASLFVVIGMLVVRNDSWIYTRPGWLDPWAYVGFGYQYDNPQYWPGHYKSSRLPWVLLEFYVRSFFSPVAAQYVLQVGCRMAEAALFFLAIRRLFADVPALIGAAFLVSITFAHGPAHSSGGADYHTVLAGALFALSFWALTVAAEKPDSANWAFGFGAAFGATLHTSPLYLNFVPALLLHYVAVRGSPRWSEGIVRLGLLSGAGAIAVTLGLCLVNWLHGRDFWFFMPQIEYTSFYLLNRSNTVIWWRSWDSEWYRQSGYLGLLAAGLMLSMVLSAMPAAATLETRTLRLVRAVGLQFLFLGLLWMAWQSMGRVALQPGYYAHPLWFPLSAMVAGLVALAIKAHDGPRLVAIAAITIVAFALPYSFPARLGTIGQLLPAAAFYKVLLVFLAAFALAGVVRIARRGIYVLILALGLANALSAEHPELYAKNACKASRDAHLAVIDMHHFLASLDPTFTRVFVWSARDEEQSLAPCAIMPTRFFADAVVHTGFWHLANDRTERAVYNPYEPVESLDDALLRSILNPKPIIVLVTTRLEPVRVLRDRFAALGLQYGPPERKTFTNGVVSVPVFILR